MRQLQIQNEDVFKNIYTRGDKTYCYIAIYPVEATISRKDLQRIVEYVRQIRRAMRALEASPLVNIEPNRPITAEVIGVPGTTDIQFVSYTKQTKIYTISIRGVQWKVHATQMHEFIKRSAIPFLARCTTNKLIDTMNQNLALIEAEEDADYDL